MRWHFVRSTCEHYAVPVSQKYWHEMQAAFRADRRTVFPDAPEPHATGYSTFATRAIVFLSLSISLSRVTLLRLLPAASGMRSSFGCQESLLIEYSLIVWLSSAAGDTSPLIDEIITWFSSMCRGNHFQASVAHLPSRHTNSATLRREGRRCRLTSQHFHPFAERLMLVSCFFFSANAMSINFSDFVR